MSWVIDSASGAGTFSSRLLTHFWKLAGVSTTARRLGLAIHLDGARLFHAAVALGVEPAAIARNADTVVVSLCKGIGAPAGAILAGSADLILTARTIRSVFRLAYRQAEGLIGSVISLLGLTLPVPDHTTLSRRSAGVAVPRPQPLCQGSCRLNRFGTLARISHKLTFPDDGASVFVTDYA